jgi:hypothetical protein
VGERDPTRLRDRVLREAGMAKSAGLDDDVDAIKEA